MHHRDCHIIHNLNVLMMAIFGYRVIGLTMGTIITGYRVYGSILRWMVICGLPVTGGLVVGITVSTVVTGEGM